MALKHESTIFLKLVLTYYHIRPNLFVYKDFVLTEIYIIIVCILNYKKNSKCLVPGPYAQKKRLLSNTSLVQNKISLR